MSDKPKRTILIVDDEEIIREFLNEVLQDNYDISMACDGDEAIEKLKKQRYDLVITDLKMPHVSGEEVVKYANDTYPDARVVVISGYSSLFTVSQSVNNGACAFLSKPFSIKELVQTVDNCIGE